MNVFLFFSLTKDEIITILEKTEAFNPSDVKAAADVIEGEIGIKKLLLVRDEYSLVSRWRPDHYYCALSCIALSECCYTVSPFLFYFVHGFISLASFSLCIFYTCVLY